MTRQLHGDRVAWNTALVAFAEFTRDWRVLPFCDELDKRFSRPEGYRDPKRLCFKMQRTADPKLHQPSPGVRWLGGPDLNDRRVEIIVGKVRCHLPLAAADGDSLKKSHLDRINQLQERIRRTLDRGVVMRQMLLVALFGAAQTARDLFGMTVQEIIQSGAEAFASGGSQDGGNPE